MAKNKTYVGTELKMHIGFDYPSDQTKTLDNIDWDVEFYCNRTSQLFTKQGEVTEDCQLPGDAEHGGLIRENGEWYAPVETTIVGSGQLKMKFTAYIPQENRQYGDDHFRTEVAICNTNVIIE